MLIFIGFYFGTLSMIVLYNFHWYNVTKEKSYLYYALFKSAMILIIILTSSIVIVDKVFEILTACFIFIFILLFSKEFLGLNKNFRSINMVMNCVMIFVVSCFFYSVIANNYSIFNQPYSLFVSPLVFLGFFVYLNGFNPAKYYVIAWGISIVLVGLNDLNEFGVTKFYPGVPFTLMGHIIESIILSYAISIKTNIIVKEKEEQSRILIHQAKLASMGQMLENISHQWRQPLNRISAFIINMQTYIYDKYKNESYLIDTLNQSQFQLEYMSNTINDFTSFNKKSKDKVSFFASEVIEEATAIIGGSLEQKGILFEASIDTDFSVYSYKNELAQVVLNLIQNSQDALAKREVAEPWVKVLVDSNRVSVQDNAGGIETEVADHIFEPYFTTKSNTSSLGLGLYMSKVILNNHFGAKLELEQTEQYTSFNILFES